MSSRFSVEKHKEWILSSLPGENSSPSSSKQENAASGRRRNQQQRVRIPTHLILHLDINETILLGDDAGGDSRHDSVQKMLAKSAFCQLPSSHDAADDKNSVTRTTSTAISTAWEETEQTYPTHWWDGQEMGRETSPLPPLYTGWEWPPGCCPYYRTGYKKLSKRFVDEHHGRIYKPVLQACEEALAQNHSNNHILPAFYRTLEGLISNVKTKKDDSSFQIVFRTFGSDIEDMAQVVTEFAQGKHPDYPHVRYPELELPKEHLYQGRWKAIDDKRGSKENPNGYIYELWNADETTLVASGDAEILQLLSQHSICGIRDDYRFWKQNGWDPTAGKPVWVPSYEHNNDRPYDHHLFFDDNIHNLEHDGIACVRRQITNDGPYTTLHGASMHQESQGVHLIRVPTIEPVLDPNWYLEQIHQARERLRDRLTHQHQGAPLEDNQGSGS